MNDAAAETTPRANTAGGLLRQARQSRGLHIAALAASIKVTQRKLELLETDQFDKLPDATFTRALAQTVCRTLKVDATPILALLPPAANHRLEQVSEGLNMPFAERPGRLVPQDWATVATPAVWIALLLLLGAVAIYFMPAGWLPLPRSGSPSASAVTTVPSALPVASGPFAGGSAAGPAMASEVGVMAPAVAAVAAAASGITDPVFPPESAASASPTEGGAAGMLQVRATGQSWVEVTDARGQSLLSRLVKAGEAVGVDGALPMKVKIGNADATQLTFRGQPLELAPYTRDNVARFELK